jgi:hypothetical protein
VTRVDLVNSAAAVLRMNDETADADGNLWGIRSLSGWGAVTPAVQTVKRMSTDGMVVTNATTATRSIIVSGYVQIGASSDAFEALAAFETACDSITADGKVRVYEPAGTRHALVRLSGAPSMTLDPGPNNLVNWSVQFFCPNPALQAGA